MNIKICFSGEYGWYIPCGELYLWHDCILHKMAHGQAYSSAPEIYSDGWYETKEKAEATLLKWEATFP